VAAVVLAAALGGIVATARPEVPWQQGLPEKAAPGLGAADKPELDIVVKTSLRVTPQHTEAYLAAMRAGAETCLGGLVQPGAPAGAPADGAARYRLLIEYAGTVKMAPAVIYEQATRSASRAMTEGHRTVDVEGAFLSSKQTGNFRFQLTRWNGTKYVAVENWAAPYADTYRLPVDKAVSNKEMGPYRNAALMKTLPDGLTDALLGHLLPVRIVKSSGSPGTAQTVTVSVQNRSPWPLKRLDARLEWSDERSKDRYRYGVEITHSGLLMPGKQVILTGKGEPMEVTWCWEAQQPARLQASPLFDPTRGPEGISRLVAGMKGKDAEGRKQGLEALGVLAPEMVPEESAAAVDGLAMFLSHDAPTAEADLPQDVLRTLVEVGRKSAAAFTGALRHENPGVRLGACWVLEQLQVSDKAILARLRSMVNDKSEAVAKAAAKALTAAGQTPPPAKAKDQPPAKPEEPPPAEEKAPPAKTEEPPPAKEKAPPPAKAEDQT
jgi:hypothetical protein